MGIDITNELSEAVEKEISVTLESIKQKLLDLFDYNEVNNTDEILENFELIYAALSILDDEKGLGLCSSIMSVISSFKKGDLTDRDSLVNEFLLLKEYIDLPEDIRDDLDLSQRIKCVNVNEGIDRSILILTESLSELELVKDEEVGKIFWQKVHKVSRVLKNEAKSKEIYKIFWLNQVISALGVKEELSISDEDAVTLCLDLSEFIKNNLSDSELTKHTVDLEIKKLNEVVGGLKSTRGVNYSPPQRSLFSNEIINIGIIFPVSSETIKTISYYIKNKFSSIKSSFESSVESGGNIPKSIIINLKEIHAIFNLLEYKIGEDLVDDTVDLLCKDLEDVSVIEKIAENLVITEDLLWDLDYIEKPGLINKLKNKRNKKKDNLQIRAVKHIIGKVSNEFFSTSKNEAIEEFALLSNSNYFMQQASKVHEIHMASLMSGEKSLSTVLKKTEYSFLFLVTKNNLLSQGAILNVYIDLLVTYEVLFNQYKTALFMDKRSIKLLDKSQQALSSAIRFNIEAIASPTYISFAQSDSISKLEVNGDYTDEKIGSSSQTDVSDVDVQSEEDFTVSPLESFKSAIEDLNEGQKEESNIEGNVDSINSEVSNQLYSEESLMKNLSVSKDINSVELSEIDEDIFEIFLEEASGIGQDLIKSIAKLSDNLFNEDAIADSRRYFHTLKGSGRMIGLNVFGEFAWQHEDLLNNVVSGAFDINQPLIEQLNKATKIVNQAVNLSPFEENRNELLLSAAEAEALKYLLLGKEKGQVETSLSDKDMDSIVEKISNKQISGNEKELSSNEDIQSYIKSSHESSQEMVSSFEKWRKEGFELNFDYKKLVDSTKKTERMAKKGELGDISKVANKTSSMLHSLPFEKDKQFTAVTQLIGNIVTEIRDVLSKIRSGDVGAEVKTEITSKLDDMLDSLTKMMKSDTDDNTGNKKDREKEGVGSNTTLSDNEQTKDGVKESDSKEQVLTNTKIIKSEENGLDINADGHNLNLESMISNINDLSAKSSNKDYENIIDSIHDLENSMGDEEHTDTSWESLSNLEDIIRRLQGKKIFPTDKEKDAIEGAIRSAMDGDFENKTSIDNLMEINSNINTKDSQKLSSETIDSFREALEQFVKHAEKPAKDSIDIFQDWKNSKFKEKSLLNKLQENVDTIQEGANIAELDGALELSSSVSNTLDRIDTKNIQPSESVTDGIETSLTELDKSVKDITAGGTGIISPTVISNMVSYEKAESIGNKQLDLANLMKGLDTPLMEPNVVATENTSKDREKSQDKKSGENYLDKNNKQIQTNIEGKKDTEESLTIDSSIQSIEQFAQKASNPVKKSLDNFSDWEESDFSEKEPLNKLQDNVEEVNSKAKTSNFDDATELTGSVLDTLDRIDNENIKPDSSVASGIENSLTELDKTVEDIIKGGEGSINKDVISKMANINAESSLGKPIKSKHSDDESFSLETNNSLKDIDDESLADLATSIKAQTDLIKEFSKKAKSPINKSLKNFDDWEETGFEEKKPLNKLQKNVERIKENAEDADFDEALTLTDSISNTLERIESEDIKPHKDVADTIEQSLTELDKSVDDIEKGGEGNLSKDVIVEMAKKEAAYNIGSKIKKDDEKVTEKVELLDNVGGRANNLTEDFKGSKENLDGATATFTQSQAELDKTIENIGKGGDISLSNSIVVDMVKKEVAYSSEFKAKKDNSKYGEIAEKSELSANEVVNTDSQRDVLGNLQSLENNNKAQKKSNDILKNNSNLTIESSQEALEQFVKHAEKPAKDSLDIFQDWKNSKFKEKSLLNKLQENVDTIQEGANIAELDGALELSSSVSNTLDRIDTKNIQPSESVTDGIETSLTELDKSVKDITAGGTGIISPTVISNMVSYEKAESIGNKQLDLANLKKGLDTPLMEPNVVATENTSKDREKSQDKKSGENYLDKNNKQIQTNIEGKKDTEESLTIDSSIQSIEQFAQKASNPVKKSLDNFSDWEESDFSEKEPLNKLQDNVEEVNSKAKTSNFDDATELTGSDFRYIR